MQALLNELLHFAATPEGMLLSLVIFSCGIGVGAALIQVNSIATRGAVDAVTSIGTWVLLLAFSAAATYYLWELTSNLVPSMITGLLGASSLAGLFVSVAARRRLAEVAESRRQPADEEALQNYTLKRTAFHLRERMRRARGQR